MSAIVRESATKWRRIKQPHSRILPEEFLRVTWQTNCPTPLPVATTFHTDIYLSTVAEMHDVMLRGALEWALSQGAADDSF